MSVVLKNECRDKFVYRTVAEIYLFNDWTGRLGDDSSIHTYHFLFLLACKKKEKEGKSE